MSNLGNSTLITHSNSNDNTVLCATRMDMHCCHYPVYVHALSVSLTFFAGYSDPGHFGCCF